MAPRTPLGSSLMMSSKKMMKREGERTPPWGTPCLSSFFLLFLPWRLTLALRFFKYCLIQVYILLVIPALLSLCSSPLRQTLSNAFSRSIHTANVLFPSWKASSMLGWDRLLGLLWICVDEKQLVLGWWLVSPPDATLTLHSPCFPLVSQGSLLDWLAGSSQLLSCLSLFSR